MGPSPAPDFPSLLVSVLRTLPGSSHYVVVVVILLAGFLLKVESQRSGGARL